MNPNKPQQQNPAGNKPQQNPGNKPGQNNPNVKPAQPTNKPGNPAPKR